MIISIGNLLSRIKKFIRAEIVYCSDCEQEKNGKYCYSCQKETADLHNIVKDYDYGKASETLKINQKQPDIKGYIKKIFNGYQPSINKEEHPDGVERHMNIDRYNNWYDETVWDNKTGKKIRDVYEPLNQHIPNSQK
jgi:hypothetical protein